MSQRALIIKKEAGQVGTIANLTGVYESIASMRIAKVKEKVTKSQQFFAELWQIYTQLRVDPASRLVASRKQAKRDKPNVFLVLTSEGGLSGDIDQRIVRKVIENYDPKTTDLIVIGAHGATQFVQNKVKIKRYFRLPDVDQAVDVSLIINEVIGYKKPTVWYQHYISLSQQEPERMDLLSRVRELGDSSSGGEIISPRDYVFEPSVEAVVVYLESVMMGIALSQVILESRLAQYASRFTAMSAAEHRAGEMKTELNMAYSRAKRGAEDDVIKETVNAMHALGGEK